MTSLSLEDQGGPDRCTDSQIFGTSLLTKCLYDHSVDTLIECVIEYDAYNYDIFCFQGHAVFLSSRPNEGHI